VRCDARDRGINLAIPVSGGVRTGFFLFANMNGEDCLLSVVVICSHDENPALCQSLDSSKWPMGKALLVDDIIHKNFSYSFIRNTCPLYYRWIQFAFHSVQLTSCAISEHYRKVCYVEYTSKCHVMKEA
jgi:hypothetical protein